jgi:hypothetical protein
MTKRHPVAVWYSFLLILILILIGFCFAISDHGRLHRSGLGAWLTPV